MENKYYIQIFIEKAGTPYLKENSKNDKSVFGHMWFRIYALDKYDNEIERFDAGYTPKGIVNDDDEAYLGNPACQSSALEITKMVLPQQKNLEIQTMKFLQIVALIMFGKP